MSKPNMPSAAAACAALALIWAAPAALAEAPKPREVDYYIPPLSSGAENPNPFLASGVAVGALVTTYYTAGTGPRGSSLCGLPGTPEFYIDPKFFPDCALPPDVSLTEAHGISVMDRIQENLAAQDLTLEDVIFLRIYLEAPPGADRADYSGWNEAYRRFFANVDLVTGEVLEQYDPIVVNATRPARSNIEVATLPVLGWLVEVEAVAAFPPKKKGKYRYEKYDDD